MITRRKFIKSGTLSLGAFSLMGFSQLQKLSDSLPETEMMPVLFVGHGNPMNAIIENQFHKTWVDLGKTLQRPQAILSISAHWITQGETLVSVLKEPRTIHDFGGFPQELFDQQYPAPGAPEFAEAAIEMAQKSHLQPDETWGLDHGTWSVLKPMFPEADIPVFQISIDYNKPASFHYQLARELKALRKKGLLILGSGNSVHNLRMMRQGGEAFDWAIEFDNFIKTKAANRDFDAIVNYDRLGAVANMAHPTVDHLLPLMYSIGMVDQKDEMIAFNEAFDLASVSMWSFYTQKV